MKSQINVEKTASSALLFTVFGVLAANLSPAVAAPAVNKTTSAVSVKSSTQGFSASTHLASVKNQAKAALTANLPSAVASNTSPESVDASPVTNQASAKSARVSEGGTINNQGAIKSEENHSYSIHRSSSPNIAFGKASELRINQRPSWLENIRLKADKLHLSEEGKPSASKSFVASSANILPQFQSSVTDGHTLTASSTATQPQVKELTAPISPKGKALLKIAQTTQDEAGAENANPQSLEDSADAEDSMTQVTNVSQLRDVRPGDWAYEALRELVERYGCIAGYPDGTYRGNRAMTRYEFAAGLRACLNQIEKLIAASTTNFVSKQDLEALRRLTNEFQAEIAALGTRVDKLEGRVGFVEAHQFSTTTRLFGQAIFGVQGRTNNNITLAGFRFADPNTNINVINNVQLSLLTQFSPRSILLTGIAAGNGFTGGLTNDTNLGYELNTGNSVILSDLSFRQLIGNNFALIVGPAGVNPVNVFRGVNRVEGSGQGPLSLFAQRNPILNIGSPQGRIGIGQAGVGFDWQIVPRASLQAVYSVSNAEDPALGGFFGGGSIGKTTVGAQLTYTPIDTVDISLDYLNAYSNNGFLGTGVGDDQLALSNRLDGRVPLKTNAFGGTVEWRVTPRVTVGGWGGYTTSHIPGQSGSVQTINWMGFLNFPDLFGRGNLAGIYVGQPPRIISSDLPAGRNIPRFITQGIDAEGGEPNRTLHLEAFYRLRVTDNITLTPGVIVILNPRHNAANDTITIGSLRTTFSF